MTDSLRILLIGLNYAPETTGIAPYAAGLAEGLADRGYQVRVLTAHPHYPQWRVWEGHGGWSVTETSNGVAVTRLRHYVPDGRSALRRLLSELSFGLRAVTQRWAKPDVVVLISPPLFASALVTGRARWLTRVPSVMWVQDLYGLGVQETGQASGSLARLVSALEAGAISRQNRVVAIHDRFAETIKEMPGVGHDCVDVVRNWSHLGPPPADGIDEIREALGWSADETVVLHAGNQGAKQGLENVVEAGRLAVERGDRLRFVLLGDGNQRERLEALAHGVTTVQFMDPLPGSDFERAMAAADVLLVNELPGVGGMAVPSKLTSYFAAGRPVLAATDARSTTAGELEASGGGVRVDPDDPRLLLEAVLHLRDNPTDAREMGEAGRRYRNEVLTAVAALDAFERTVRAAVSATKPSA